LVRCKYDACGFSTIDEEQIAAAVDKQVLGMRSVIDENAAWGAMSGAYIDPLRQ
jgi:hypothetical protein